MTIDLTGDGCPVCNGNGIAAWQSQTSFSRPTVSTLVNLAVQN